MLRRASATLTYIARARTPVSLHPVGQRCLGGDVKGKEDEFAPGAAELHVPSAGSPAAEDGSTYDEFKEVARRTGDASKEWLEGSAATGSTIYKEMKQGAEQMLESTRRAVMDTTADAHAAAQKSYFQQEGERRKGGGLEEVVKESLSEIAHRLEAAAGAIKEKVAGDGRPGGHVEPAVRSPAQRAKEAAFRESELTHGTTFDNPKGKLARENHTITP